MAHPQEPIGFKENIPTQINIPRRTFYSFLVRTGAKPPPQPQKFFTKRTGTFIWHWIVTPIST